VHSVNGMLALCGSGSGRSGTVLGAGAPGAAGTLSPRTATGGRSDGPTVQPASTATRQINAIRRDGVVRRFRASPTA
jgi:hypothetical protein